MKKPKIGDEVELVGKALELMEVGRVLEVHDDIDVWWDTAQGENKMGLMEEYGEAKLRTAEWFAQVENVEQQGETMAIASFEVKGVK